MSDSSPRTPARGVALVAALAVFTWRATVSWDTVVDDAWISARYAEHFAEGFGLVYNAGEPPVEGYTNLAFTVLLGLGRLLGVGMHTLLTGIPYLFGLAGIALSVPLTRALAGRDGAFTLVPAWVMACSPHYAVASTNGLESSMMVATTLAAVWAHLALVGRGRWLAAAAAAAAILTRPEGLAVAGLLLVHDLWTRRRAPRGAAPMLAGVLGTTACLTAFRLAVYGDWVPNTWRAKAAFPIAETFDVNAVYLVPEQATLWAGLAAGLVGGLLPRWSERRLVAFALAAGLGVIPLTVTLWMPGLRLFLPALALSVCLLVAAAAQHHRLGLHHATWALVPGMIAFHAHSGDRVRHYDWRHSVQPGNGTELAARHLAAHAPPGAWLATRDAGCFAYWVGTGVKVAELHQRALTQPHPDGDDAHVREYTPVDPEFIVTTLRREDVSELVYGNDKLILRRTTVPYRYVGRIYQHYHRYYDLYVRADTGVEALPEQAVVSWAGIDPPIAAPRPPGAR